MLEELDQIDWGSLHHAYGKAHDTPGHIRNLASEDEEIREAAFDKLFYSIVHQGNLSVAAEYAFPFLIELLESPGVQSKHNILTIIAYMADGSDVAQTEGYYRHYMTHGTDEQKKNAQVYKEWKIEISGMLKKYLDLYTTFLDEENDEVFRSAVYLLTFFPDADKEIGQAVLAGFLSATDNLRKIDLLWLLGRLNKDKYAYLFQEVYNSADEHLLKFTAAINAGLIKEKLSEEQIEYLIQAVAEDIDVLYENIEDSLEALGDHWTTLGDIFSTANDSIKNKAFAVFLKVLAKRRYLTKNQQNTLLSIAFSEWENQELSNPDEKRKQAVSAVADSVFKYKPRDLMDHETRELAKFDLPTTLEEIADYLGVPPDAICQHYTPPPGPVKWWQFWRS